MFSYITPLISAIYNYFLFYYILFNYPNCVPVRRTTTKKAEWIITSVRPFFIPTPAYRRHKSTENPPKTKESPQINRKIRHLFLNHRDKEEKRFMDLKSRSQMTENAEFPCSSCHAQPPKNSKCLGIHSLT